MIEMVKLADKGFKTVIINKIYMFKKGKKSMNMTSREKDDIKKTETSR